MAGVRRKGRVLALQVLFEVDTTAHDMQRTLERSLAEASLPPQGEALARELVEGVWRERQRLDQLIQEHAPVWPVEQISAVDRNILRIAIFEILFNNKTPPKAAANEAVELAKLFGSESIHRFINGVLGSVIGALDTRKQTPTLGR